MFWLCWRFVFVCTICICYVSICRTHTQICMKFHASFISVIQRSISSVTLVARTYWLVTLILLSCWFNMSCLQVMLRMCFQGHVYTSSLAQTLSHFSENMWTKLPSIIHTPIELHYVVSALSDQVMLPRIVQSLKFPPRQSTLCNPRIDLADYHLKQHWRFPRSHLNLRFLQSNSSILPLVNRRVWLGSDLGLHSKKLHRRYHHTYLHFLDKLRRQEGQRPTTCHCTISENCIVLSVIPLASQPTAPPRNGIVLLDYPPAARHPAPPENYSNMFCMPTSQFYAIFF